MSEYLDDFLTALHLPTSTTAGWELHTLTLINWPKPPISTILRDTLSARIASGHPIRLSSSIITALSDDLEWLAARVDVEKTTLYSDLSEDSFVIRWSDNDD